MKLNLGCGDCEIAGYENIDRKKGQEVFPLNVPDGSCDEIRASHILEHFPHAQVLEVLKHWVRKLKIDGVLKIAVPDFGKIARDYVAGRKVNTTGYLMGGQIDENDYHKSLFDAASLAALMDAAGVGEITKFDGDANDCSNLPVSLNLKGIKREEKSGIKISAVMSMPRLAFTENFFSAFRALAPLGIQLSKGTGAYWGQCLTRMMEKHLDDGTDFILTIDYDTWFTKEHVHRLAQLMVENPEVSAIVPLQTQREGDFPLLGLKDESGHPINNIDNELIEKNQLIKLATGHFGLTMFRVADFKKLKKPWFLPIPDQNGSWHEGRVDEDIYFWRNLEDSGLTACLAPHLNIGHLELMVTYPGTIVDEWKPIHMHVNDVEDNGPPAHCIPQIEIKE